MNASQLILSSACISFVLCMTPTDSLARESPDPQYQLIIKDVPAARHFELTLQSLDERPICVELRRWPNRAGRVHFGNSWVVLHTSAGLFRAKDENFGRCVGPECLIHIGPKKALHGFIAYFVFGDEQKIARLPKRRLQIDVRPMLCSLVEKWVH
jgi:hypothetical protein